MTDDHFTAYRDQIETLLRNAEQLLTESERDALRLAIKGYRSRGVRLDQTVPGLMPRGFNIGERIVAQLDDADRELSAEQVRELEQLIETALPNI